MPDDTQIIREEVSIKVVAFESINQARVCAATAQWVATIARLHATATLLNFGGEIYVAVCANHVDATKAEQLILPIFKEGIEVSLRREIIEAVVFSHTAIGGRGVWTNDPGVST